MAKVKSRPSSDNLSGSVTHLLHRTLQLALDFHGEAAGPAAITQRQYTVLTAASAGDGLTQNDLVRATGIDRSTLADLVARMLAKGLLMRERSATDARANNVRVSEAGRLALGAGAGAAAAADARLLALLSAKKRDTFLKTLGALASAADGEVPDKAKSAAPKKPKSDRVPKAAAVVAPKVDKKHKKKKAKKGKAAPAA